MSPNFAEHNLKHVKNMCRNRPVDLTGVELPKIFVFRRRAILAVVLSSSENVKKIVFVTEKIEHYKV